jgi:hypothetical protein
MSNVGLRRIGMPRLAKDLIAFAAYLFFGAIEIVVTWAPFLLSFLIPVGIAWMMGAKTGDNLSVGAVMVGLALMAGWYFYLDSGAGKRIEMYFRKLTHSTIRQFGAGDALLEDAE